MCGDRDFMVLKRKLCLFFIMYACFVSDVRCSHPVARSGDVATG